MKCPKCEYLGFETGDRCKNCGYDFSLAWRLPHRAGARLAARAERAARCRPMVESARRRGSTTCGQWRPRRDHAVGSVSGDDARRSARCDADGRSVPGSAPPAAPSSRGPAAVRIAHARTARCRCFTRGRDWDEPLIKGSRCPAAAAGGSAHAGQAAAANGPKPVRRCAGFRSIRSSHLPKSRVLGAACRGPWCRSERAVDAAGRNKWAGSSSDCRAGRSAHPVVD